MGMLSVRGCGPRKLSRQQDLWGMQADVRVRKARPGWVTGEGGRMEKALRAAVFPEKLQFKYWFV